jgi:serine/threonine-protein kinase HipA
MSLASQKLIEVWADWHTLKKPTLVGKLSAQLSRGKEVFSFEYHADWLKSPYAFSLDPSLKLYSGKQYLTDEKTNFGVFLDSSPDRWGRTLIQRRESLLAQKEKRSSKKLLESDFLLGVFDQHRMGGLRFKFKDGLFLDDNKDYATPPWSSLRELEAISLKLEDEDAENKKDYSQWLRTLVVPGSSLGGARPKATICDTKGHLWIAKFPSRNDHHDVGGWEYIIHQLAQKCDLQVPEAQVMKVGSRRHTYLSKRFDRVVNNSRIHFSSAMTLLERNDGDSARHGASYLELVDFLIESGANTKGDLEELWKRIVFSICISNTDDHLRNHGFLLTREGWCLSPAYDMNPNPYGGGLSLNISENSNQQSLDLALDVCSDFRVDFKKAQKIISKIKTEVSKWPSLAKQLKISKSEQDHMADAFLP